MINKKDVKVLSNILLTKHFGRKRSSKTAALFLSLTLKGEDGVVDNLNFENQYLSILPHF